ncbi:hypothetical protein L6452_32792 [Arctium lappa]|uniref:Uncharacterized protein n=1 Tax=Arctium lappa TaxID=4217 RepID=A0ACB8Z5Z1_ARCLA|nr:hypothetical protein L6452_32792 [Arctium lappa]
MFNSKIQKLRSDNGTYFRNAKINSYLLEEGITLNFSTARTPQNGDVERKNRTLVEAAKTMLGRFNLPSNFWAEAVPTTCFTKNRVTIVKRFKKTSYELINNRKPSVNYFHVFGCRCYILNDRESLGKFDKKADDGKFIGYSLSSKAFRVFNLRTRTSINVSFDDTRSSNKQIVKSTTKNVSESLKLREYKQNKIFENLFDDDDNSEFLFRDVQRATSEEPHTTGTTLSGPSDVTPSTSLNASPNNQSSQVEEQESSEAEDEQKTSEETLDTFVEETQEPASPSLEPTSEPLNSTTEMSPLSSLKHKLHHKYMLPCQDGQEITP